MSNSKRSSAKFWLLAVGVIIVTSAALAFLWPLVRTQAVSQSRSLMSQARQTNGGEALSDYQLSVWLNPNNHTARLGLAQAELSANEPAAALVNLGQAGEGAVVNRVRVQALIETFQYRSAATAAAKLSAEPHPSDADLLLAALANQLSNNTLAVPPLLARLSSPEALQAASRVQAGKLALAEVLYSTGLLRSSNEILASLPSSYQRDLLMAQIYYTWGGTLNTSKATALLLAAASQDPANPAPRQLLVTIYRDNNQFTLADDQQSLLNKLSVGQP